MPTQDSTAWSRRPSSFFASRISQGVVRLFGNADAATATIKDHGQDVRLACAIGFPVALTFALFNLANGFVSLGAIEGMAALILLPPAYLLSRFARMLLPAEILVMLCVTTINVALLHYGGIHETGIYWIFSMPLVAFYVSGQRRGWLWSGGFLALTWIIPPAAAYSQTQLLHFRLALLYYTGIAASFNMLRTQFAARLHMQAMTDFLTGISNRRYFFSRFHEEFARHLRYRGRFCLLIIDLDNLKTINGSLGHPAGDAAIVYCAMILDRVKRQGDVIGRLGGDEFGCLMIGADVLKAQDFFSRLQRMLVDFSFEGNNIPLQISSGAVSIEGDAWPDCNAMYRIATARLNQAKLTKNCICCQ